jgi:antitoxin (DNA-binding transcriptional repressor) of toxin-antitoxin stability system
VEDGVTVSVTVSNPSVTDLVTLSPNPSESLGLFRPRKIVIKALDISRQLLYLALTVGRERARRSEPGEDQATDHNLKTKERTMEISQGMTARWVLNMLNAALDAARNADGYVEPGRLAAVNKLCDAIGIVGGSRLYVVDPAHPVVVAVEM